ncbi:MAG: hypothetical protein IID38_10825 [Planctomycetes bacterium]|nr:hypothetical protein [Planctomycetota bacterium]
MPQPFDRQKDETLLGQRLVPIVVVRHMLLLNGDSAPANAKGAEEGKGEQEAG